MLILHNFISCMYHYALIMHICQQKKYYPGSVILKKGFIENKRPQAIYPDDEGVINIEINELERVEIRFEGTMGLAPLSLSNYNRGKHKGSADFP